MDGSNTITAGIDTAKDKLDIAVHGGPAFTVGNDSTGYGVASRKMSCFAALAMTGWGYEIVFGSAFPVPA